MVLFIPQSADTSAFPMNKVCIFGNLSEKTRNAYGINPFGDAIETIFRLLHVTHSAYHKWALRICSTENYVWTGLT